MQKIKKVHEKRLREYQKLIKQDLGSKIQKQVSNIGMSIYNNERNVFVGVMSFDYRMYKDYKKYFWQTITAQEAVEVDFLNESGIGTGEIKVFESKVDKSENFFSGENIQIENKDENKPENG